MSETVIDSTCSIGACKDKGSYSLPGYCSNCGWTGSVKMTKGHEFPSRVSCPHCGCSQVHEACAHCLGTGRLYLNVVGVPCPGCRGTGRAMLSAAPEKEPAQENRATNLCDGSVCSCGWCPALMEAEKSVEQGEKP